MGLGIGALFGKIFGTEKALNSIVDGVSNGLDKLVYTSEEKSDDAAKDRSEARAMIVQWMETTQGQNLARRFLALMITGVWLMMYAVSTLGEMVQPWLSDPDFAQRFSASADALGDRANNMNGAMMLILAFYFAAPQMGSIAKAAISKFGGDDQKNTSITKG